MADGSGAAGEALAAGTDPVSALYDDLRDAGLLPEGAVPEWLRHRFDTFRTNIRASVTYRPWP